MREIAERAELIFKLIESLGSLSVLKTIEISRKLTAIDRNRLQGDREVCEGMGDS